MVQKLIGEKERLEKMISVLVADSQRLTQELDETNSLVDVLRKENEELAANSNDPNSIKKNSVRFSILDELQEDLFRRGNSRNNLPLITPRSEASLYTPRGVNLVATPRKAPLTARESSRNLTNAAKKVLENSSQKDYSPTALSPTANEPQPSKPNLKLNLPTTTTTVDEKAAGAISKTEEKKEETLSEQSEDSTPEYSFDGYFFLLAKAIHISLVLKNKDDDAITSISSRNDKTIWQIYEDVEKSRIAFHEWHDNEWIRGQISSRLIKVHK